MIFGHGSETVGYEVTPLLKWDASGGSEALGANALEQLDEVVA